MLLIDFLADLEWRIIYVGSAASEVNDQVLDSVLVGPVPAGRHRFVFQVCVWVGVWVGGWVGVWVWVHWWLSGIHSELPIERLVVQGPASGNLVLSFSLSSSGCSDHLAPPHQLTQL